MIQKVNLEKAFDTITQQWSPLIAGRVNDCLVKLVKFQGPFVWHHHDDEDEMFLVIEGGFTMRFRDGNVPLSSGEFIIIPRGVEHMPDADAEARVMLFEPATTLNTGNVRNERTRDELKTI